MKARSRRKTLVLQRVVWQGTFRGFVPKLFLFLLAAGALWTLVTLDGAKSKYDSLNAEGKNFSFTVDQTFITGVQPANENIKKWLDDPGLVKYRKFSSQRALLDTLGQIAVATRLREVNDLAVSEKKLKEELEKFAEAEKSLEAIAPEKRAAHASKPKPSPEERGYTQIKADLEKVELKQDVIRKDLNDGAEIIYDKFGKQLSTYLLVSSSNELKMSDKLLRPLLNEKTSLFVVYQAFRLTALVIVVLTFILIIVMAVSQLPLATGSETISERLKSLMSFAPSAGGEIAKAAVLGVAAVGLGTVVVAGANSLDFRPPSERVTTNTSTNTNSAKTLVEHETGDSIFSSQNLFSQYMLYRFMLEKTTNTVSLADFKPIFQVPAPIVIVRNAPASMDTAAIVTQLQALRIDLKPVTEYAGINTRLDKIVLALQTLPKDCNCEGSLKRIGDSLDQLNTLMGGPGPTPSPTPAPSPTSGSSITTVSSPTPMSSPLLAKLGALSDRLSAIERELQLIGNDNRWRQADTRNIADRTKKLIVGRTYYVVTQASVDAANEEFKQTPDSGVILKAFTGMLGRGPTDKAQFLREFYDAAANAETGDDKALLQRLKALEKQILNLVKMRG